MRIYLLIVEKIIVRYLKIKIFSNIMIMKI